MSNRPTFQDHTLTWVRSPEGLNIPDAVAVNRIKSTPRPDDGKPTGFFTTTVNVCYTDSAGTQTWVEVDGERTAPLWNNFYRSLMSDRKEH